MRRRDRLALAAVLLLAACGRTQNMRAPQAEKLSTFDVAEPPAAATQASQIAYSYEVSYALDGGSIADVEARHAALCDSLGRARCRVASSSVGDGSDDGLGGGSTASGEARLIVEARIAAAFGKRLDGIVAHTGGRVTHRGSTGEDVTKQVIDVRARVAAKQALADRLVALIRTAGGGVGDLVAAEKAYADAQAELETARGEQAVLAERVAMSDITLHYASRGAGSVFAPVAHALHDAGASFGWSIAGLVMFVVVTAPWLVLLLALRWLFRRLGWRVRWPWQRRRERADAP